MPEFKTILKYFLGLPKTLVFNFKYFKARDMIRLPVFVSYDTKLKCFKGKVEILGEIKTGMIKIGFGNGGLFDDAKFKTVWEVKGSIRFYGKAGFGKGAKISVLEKGNLAIGKDFSCGFNTALICKDNIKIGNNCLLSWDITIMDTDFHHIYNIEGVPINKDKPINISDNVWIGFRSVILKGTSIGGNCVIGANSLVSGVYEYENKIIAGNPARYVKSDVTWKR